MGKMQDVSFHNVEEFLDYLPQNELKIVEFLRVIILDCIPNCREKLAYNVPFYYKHARICYIWPSSIRWGNVNPQGVSIGFTKGFLLTDELNYLDRTNRKEIATKTFFSIDEIDVDLLKTFLFEAVAIDESMAKK